MPLPDFTPDELYLVNFAKSPQAARQSNSYMWGYLIGAAVVAGFAVYFESIPALLCSFLVVCGFRIYEDCYQSKWMSVWRSIIFKYESAVLAQDSATEDLAEP